MTSDGDAMSRLEMALEWSREPYFFPGGLIWLPLHFVLIALPSLLFKCSIWHGATAVVLLSGLLSIVLLFLLARKKFGDTVALVSALLLAVNPFHIKYSVLSMTEVPFIFFVLLAIWFLYLFLEKEKTVYLLAASLFLNCSSLIRFEGWIVSALLPFFLLYYGKSWRAFFLFGILNAVSIVGYMFVSITSTGNLIHGLTMSDLEVRYAYAAVENKWQHVWQGMRGEVVLPLWLSPFLFYGIYLGLRQRKELPLLFTGAFLLAFISWKVVRFETEPGWRYFSTGIVLLLPYLSLSIVELTKNMRWVRTVVVGVIAFFLVKHSVEQFTSIQQNLGDSNGIAEAADWIKARRKATEKVFYHAPGFDFPGFRLLSETPKEELYYPHYPGMKKFSNYEEYTPVVLMRLMQDTTYHYFVYRTETSTDSFLNLAEVKPAADSLFTLVYQEGKYKILQSKHP